MPTNRQLAGKRYAVNRGSSDIGIFREFLLPCLTVPPVIMGLMLNQSFSAKLEKSPNHGGWTYVVWPDSVNYFRTKGLVKISGKIDGYPFRASFMAMGDGQHMLPIKAETRKAIGKDVGQTVHVVLEERL